MKIKNKGDLDKLRETGARALSPKRPKISISMSTCGIALGAGDLYQKLLREKRKRGTNFPSIKSVAAGSAPWNP